MLGHKVEIGKISNPVLFEIITLDVPKKNPEKKMSLLLSFGQDFHLDDRDKIWISKDYIANIKKTIKKVKPIDLKKINYPTITQVKLDGVEISAEDASVLFQVAGIDYAFQGKVLYVGRQFFC